MLTHALTCYSIVVFYLLTTTFLSRRWLCFVVNNTDGIPCDSWHLNMLSSCLSPRHEFSLWTGSHSSENCNCMSIKLLKICLSDLCKISKFGFGKDQKDSDDSFSYSKPKLALKLHASELASDDDTPVQQFWEVVRLSINQ